MLFPLQDKIQFWEDHRAECKTVNCIAGIISVMDILFIKDYPDVNSNATIEFVHKILYQTSVSDKVACNLENVEYNYVDGQLCVTVKCNCDEPFVKTCLTKNLRVLCKAVMQVIDGAYRISSPSLSSISSDELQEEKEEINGICKECHTPIFLCCCLGLAMSKSEFLFQLQNFSLCNACASCMPNCVCKYKVWLLYRYYEKCIVNNLVPKRMNEVKRLAYLSSCNVQICLNCNKVALYCICDGYYKKVFPE